MSSNNSTNHVRRTNLVKEIKVDKTRQNSKCRFCGDRDETINHILSVGSKLAQKCL